MNKLGVDGEIRDYQRRRRRWPASAQATAVVRTVMTVVDVGEMDLIKG